MKTVTASREEPEFREPLVATLAEFAGVLERASIDHALIGGLAVAVHGRPRYSVDVDFLVRPEDAQRALDAAGDAGFDTDPINPHWIYKATKNDVLVDIIFKTRGDVYLDEEMVRRIERRSFRGVDVAVIAPEDLLVIKALVHDEETPRHWWDALAILTRGRDLDWDYVVRRAVKGPHRVLALLHYARSLGIVVPPLPLRRLGAAVLEAGGGRATRR